MQPGDSITVSALHADGQWYRRWRTTIESIDEGCIVTFTPVGGAPVNTSHVPLLDAARGAVVLSLPLR